MLQLESLLINLIVVSVAVFIVVILFFWVIHQLIEHKFPEHATRGDPRVWCKVCQCYHNMAREILLYPTPKAHELTWDDPDHPPR